MSQIFTLSDPKILGEEHPKYGFSVWDNQPDGDMPIMFNSKNGNILPGTRILAEDAEVKTSAKGKQYLRLKGVKVEDNPVEKDDQTPFEEKPEPTFEKAKKDDKFLKDVSDVPVRMIQSLLPYFDVQSLLTNKDQYMTLVETARQLTEDALKMVEHIRND